MKTMKLWRIAFAMLAAFSLASCSLSVKNGEKETAQRTDSIEVVSNRDTLRLVISDKLITESDSIKAITLSLPLDSLIVELSNRTDSTCSTGEDYTIEQQAGSKWTPLPVKQREDGTVYAFPAIGYELPAHSSRYLSIHMLSDLYDLEPGKEYRIRKEYFINDERKTQYVYGYFKVE